MWSRALNSPFPWSITRQLPWLAQTGSGSAEETTVRVMRSEKCLCGEAFGTASVRV